MHESTVERWSMFEVTLEGPKEGNPFLEVELSATFRHKHRVIEPEGFYDGTGTYRVRFMPDTVGEWTYTTHSNVGALDGQTGTLVCTPAQPNNHGPVRVDQTYHFAYEDGTPYYPFGTTCYAWNHQGEELEAKTLESLKEAPFNKLRMCVFPKHYAFNRNEPEYHAFERRADGSFDLERFDPAFFHHLERRIGDLLELGIEADLILFHPYDRWGYSQMPSDTDARYLRYAMARLAAYRNVWWSMANEYDLMESKTMLDWDRFFRIIQTHDPYQHLRSIHNCHEFYDHNKPWVTHCSIQHHDLTQVNAWRERYRKPIVVDECAYEGDIPYNWGNITAEEMSHRLWEGVSRGGYVGHGETYLHPDDILWWSKGGVLHGLSPKRIAFLRELVEASGPLDPVDASWDLNQSGNRDHRLVYFGIHRPAYKELLLPEAAGYEIDVIDTWEMTTTALQGTYSGRCRVELPGKPYIALHIRRVE
ncbi:MAG: DUF5060 domain-containing protein [Anaerolineae bacterium]